MTQKLSAKSRPVMLLREWLESGKLSGQEPPRAVQGMSSVFAGYKPDNFRRAYNRVRKVWAKIWAVLYVTVRYPIWVLCDKCGCVYLFTNLFVDGEEKPEEVLNRRCSLSSNPATSKKQRLDYESDSQFSDVDDVEDVDVGAKRDSDEGQFRPFYMLSVWTEPQTTAQRISADIVLPTGVGADDYTLQVGQAGRSLIMRCIWPATFTDISTLHRKWLSRDGTGSMEVYHPKILGFEAPLKDLRDKNSDSVESCSKIPLPLPVESHIYGQYNLGFREDTTRVVYVYLRAFVDVV